MLLNKHLYGFYGPDSITWKAGSDAIILLGGARAVLMQLAHPLVAIGVCRHSSYLQDPLGRAERTFLLGQMLTFGTPDKAIKAAHTINKLHTNVVGTLPIDAGMYSKGTGYRAKDQELLLWVHATLVDTVLTVHQLFIGPISELDQEQYYQESKEMVRFLGLLPGNMPATARDLREYVADMVHSDHLAATPQARQLARQVLFPPIPTILKPLMHLNLALTNALLPDPVRRLYGLELNDYQKIIFKLSSKSARVLIPRLSPALRELPVTRKLKHETMHTHS